MIIRELISEIRNSLRSVDVDNWVPGKFIYSKAIGITSLFIKREALKKYGTFNINFKFASDVDLSFRLFEIHQLKSFYIPEVLVKMRSGGVSNSSIKNMYKSLKDCYDVFKSHNITWPIMYILRTIIYRANHVIKSYKVKNV